MYTAWIIILHGLLYSMDYYTGWIIILHGLFYCRDCYNRWITILLRVLHTLSGVIRYSDEGVGDSGFVVWQGGSRDVPHDVKAISGLQLNGDILQDLVVEGVGTVELKTFKQF